MAAVIGIKVTDTSGCQGFAFVGTIGVANINGAKKHWIGVRFTLGVIVSEIMVRQIAPPVGLSTD